MGSNSSIQYESGYLFKGEQETLTLRLKLKKKMMKDETPI